MPSSYASAAPTTPAESYPDLVTPAPADRGLRAALRDLASDPFGTLAPQGAVWALDGLIVGHIWLTAPDFTTIELWLAVRWLLGGWAVHATLRAAHALHTVPAIRTQRRPTLIPFLICHAIVHLAGVVGALSLAVPAAAVAVVLAGRGLVLAAALFTLLAGASAALGFVGVRAAVGEAPLRVVWEGHGVIRALSGSLKGWRPLLARLRLVIITDALWLLSLPLLSFPLPAAMTLRAIVLAPPRPSPAQPAAAPARR